MIALSAVKPRTDTNSQFYFVHRYYRNVKKLLRVALHWHVPFIEDLSETVQVVW